MKQQAQPRSASIFANSLLLRVLLGVIIGSAVLHVVWQLVVGPWDPLRFDSTMDIAMRFGLDNELSMPTWLVSAMALITSGVFWLIARHSTQRAPWYLLSVIFLILSLDETSALHELVVERVHVLAGLGAQQTFTSNAWLLLAPFIFAAGVWLALWLWRRVPRQSFVRITVALLVYVTGAFGVEYMSIQIDKVELAYRIGLVVVEETLEMMGLWLALRAGILHIKETQPTLHESLQHVIGKHQSEK